MIDCCNFLFDQFSWVLYPIHDNHSRFYLETVFLSLRASHCGCFFLQAQQEETSVESPVYRECVYYLRTYGTYNDHLKFLLRNGYWNKALKFIIDHVSVMATIVTFLYCSSHLK